MKWIGKEGISQLGKECSVNKTLFVAIERI